MNYTYFDIYPSPNNYGTPSMTSTFRLNRFPKGCDADHSNYVSIFINQVSGPPVWVKYAISLLESQSLHRSPFVHNTRRGSVQFVVDRRSSSRGTPVFQVLRSFPFSVILFIEIYFFVKSQRSLLDFLHLTSFSIIYVLIFYLPKSCF